MTEKVWGGRFQEETDERVDRFNASLRFDRRLYPYDIQGSVAHCRALAKKGVFTEDEASRIVEALTSIRKDMDRGGLDAGSGHEDIHTLVEKALTDRVGPIGAKIHTGRSRNDQVALDMRLYVRDAIDRVEEALKELQKGLIELADRDTSVIMPGYTHMQRAQPVLVSHHLLAYYEMFSRDRRRFSDARGRGNVLPLGSAALAGTTFDLDREMVADALGFDAVSRNSMDAVSDRDFVLDYCFAASTLMMHLSRLCEELILWATQEFSFITLPDACCTGSSIMPQKKNPDVPELIRGKTGRVYGHLMGLLTVMKGLPLSYNKDMQEDKEALFDVADTIEDCLGVMNRLLPGIRFNGEVMKDAVKKGYLAATDLADYLVGKGETFRTAHEAVGRLVVFALDQGRELDQLTLEEMASFCPKIDEDVYTWLDPVSCVERRNLPGGTGPRAVSRALETAKRELGL